MKKERISIPRPQSAFLLIQCPNCGNEVTVFSTSTISVKCKVCDALIAENKGGKAKINGTLLRKLD
ncbi:MAG: 30S ribosomal protein S27e [Thaumarchaeota archaeon]|nr:30S ribosomal protein S27e [Nitrososphaerota archaeon]